MNRKIYSGIKGKRKFTAAKRIAAAAAALIMTAVFAVPAFAKAYLYSSVIIPDGSMRAVAHRGYSAEAPENTLPSFELAGQNGFYGAECDTQRTADGVWVIMHDETVDRTTDGTGYIRELTYEQILGFNIDAGSNAENYPGLKVPALTEYLEVCARYDLVPVIEIKSTPAELMESLAECVSTAEKRDDIVFIGFDRDCVARIKELMPGNTAYLLVSKAAQEDIDFCLENNIDGLDFSKSTKSAAVRKAMDAGLKTMVWTVDSAFSASYFYALGVRNITTNKLIPETPQGSALFIMRLLWQIRDLIYSAE